jgi:hypothetical protein
MIAARKFVGIIGGKEKVFAAGDSITADEAKELNLSAKPDLVRKNAKDEAKPA